MVKKKKKDEKPVETPETEPKDAAEQTTEETSESPAEDVEVVELTEEEEGWKDRYLRTLADLDNLKKRVHKEKDLIRKTTTREVVRSLLPCFDNLERALGSGEETDAKMLLMGVKMVNEEIQRVLGEQGVRAVRPEPGSALDPNEHEAVSRAPSDEHPEGHVLMTLEAGYLIGEIMIRPARVIVAAPAASEED